MPHKKREDYNKYMSGYRARNKEKLRAISRKSYFRHKIKRIEKSREWYCNNRERVKTLARKRVYAQAYKITLDEYDRMLSLQNGVCAICLKPDKQNRKLSVDHCHSTGKVRGLLCRACNSYIGYICDSPINATRLLEYLHVLA